MDLKYTIYLYVKTEIASVALLKKEQHLYQGCSASICSVLVL